MPRPASGYRNSAGQPIPGTSDITKRFADKSRLMWWAFNRGKAGHAQLYDDTALSIGTAVHMMAELDLQGRDDSDIEFYLQATLREPEERAKAVHAFAAFRKWRAEFHVTAIAQEISLVSEKLQYGGTLDTVAAIRKGRGLVDFKTSASGEVYEDHVLQLAGYEILWNETHPNEQLDEGCHLIVLPKDGSKPIHREFSHAQLQPFRSKFWLLRKAFELDAVCNDPKVLKGSAITPSKPSARRAVPKPPPMMPAGSMAEILRTYGHLQPGVAA